MVQFRGLAWRSTTPVNRLDRSDLSQTTPSSPAEVEVPSVQVLVDQLEAKEEQSRRRSSAGDRPSTPNFRAHPFRPLIAYSRTPSPSTVPKITNIPKEVSIVPDEVRRGLKARPASVDLECKAVPLVFTTADGDSIHQPLSRLRTPPLVDNKVPNLRPHLSPSPPSQAVEAPVVDLENLPPLPDSPFTYSQSPLISATKSPNGARGCNSLASPFVSVPVMAPLSPLNLAVDSAADTSSRADSIFRTGESHADSPIGGEPVAFIDLERTVGTMAVRGKDQLDTPRVTSPSHNTKKPLKSRSNFSESVPSPSHKEDPALSHHLSASLERPATPQSEKSMAMVTAPDTPIFGRRNEIGDVSDMTFDGSPGSAAGVKDFAVVAEVTEVTGGDICPDCDLPNVGSDDGGRPKGSSLLFSGADVLGYSASGVPSSGMSAAGILASNLPASKVPAPGIPVSSKPTADILAPGASITDQSTIPAAPEVGGGNDLYVPGSNLSRGLAVPADITGKLDPPKTPPPPSKKRMALGKGKKKGQKVIRRGRHLILRKPVLAMVIGRQLAGPTSTALKMVSQGTPVDATALKEAAVPQAVPQPVPLSA